MDGISSDDTSELSASIEGGVYTNFNELAAAIETAMEKESAVSEIGRSHV